MHHRPIHRTILTLAAAALIGAAQAQMPPVLEIEAHDHHFELSRESIPSGWTTIRFSNPSPAVHFAVLERMPEGRTIDDARRDVVPVFAEAWELIMEGRVDDGFAALGNLPAWYADVTFYGGPGMTAAGATSEVTLNLEPGYYLIECYVKTEDGIFHTELGMLDVLVVTDEANAAAEPTADIMIAIDDPSPDDGTNPESGITIDGAFVAGPLTIGVRFDAEAPPLLANDLHIARLDEGVRVDTVTAWMDWVQLEGLREPAPAHFVTGTQEMPQGHIAYLNVDLKPGRYLLISERSAATPLHRVVTVE